MSIKTLDQLIEVLTLQKANLSTYSTEVGATLQDITDVTNECNNLVAMRTYAEIIDANKQTIFGIKQAMYNGSGAMTDFPTFPAAPALVAAVTGSLQKTNDRNKRFKAAPGYTAEIGEALGIDFPPGEAVDPETVVPEIDVFGAQTGFLFSVVVTNRVDSDMWEVHACVAGTTNWQIVGSATGKSADFTWPGGGSQPVQLLVRVQLKKNNANYGQLSGIKQVTVNP